MFLRMFRVRTGVSRAAIAIVFAAAPSLFAADVLTWHNDLARTGQNLTETTLTPANVNATTFGKLFAISVDGKVYAQPLVVSGLTIPGQGVRDVLYVATEHDSVYACDANDGTLLWQASMLLPGEMPSDPHLCDKTTPELGVTATPVIDRAAGPNGTIYIVAMSKDGFGHYFQRLHALDLTSGAEEFAGPVTIAATYPGIGDNSDGVNVVFDPYHYNERTGLALSGGIIYTTWASFCDVGPYTGWIIGYDEATLARVCVLNLSPNANQGAIWMSGAAPAVDSGGFIYLMNGNGPFDTALDVNGFPNQDDYGNCFLKLLPQNNKLQVADYWTMFDTVLQSQNDRDLGSGGPVLLPDMTDSNGNVRHLAVGAGKDSRIYIVDRDNMGKFNPVSNSTLYQEVPNLLAGPEFGAPAYFNGTLYFGAANDRLRALIFTNALLGAQASVSANPFAYPGTTPSISASGLSNAIVWAVENGSVGVLHAYDATDLGNELYNSNQAATSRDHFGTGNKFAVPTIANGKVYVGSSSGSVAVFGLLSSGPTPTPTPVPAVSVSAPVPRIGQGENATYEITTLAINQDLPTVVNYSMTGSALLGTHYLLSGTPGQATIPAAASSATITLSAMKTKLKTGSETAALTITAGTAYAISEPSTATVTIVNGKAKLPNIRVSASPKKINEGGGATYTISTSAISDSQPITINYSMGGTGALGTEYILSETPGQITIPAGASSAAVTITSLANSLTKTGVTATMRIAPGSGYKVSSPKNASVKIVNVP